MEVLILLLVTWVSPAGAIKLFNTARMLSGDVYGVFFMSFRISYFILHIHSVSMQGPPRTRDILQRGKQSAACDRGISLSSSH